MPSACTTSRVAPFGISLGTKPPLAPTGTITAFLTCCAFTSPSTSVRKSCGRSDQRMPPRATLPKRRCTRFHARRIDENLVERTRQRQVGDLAALELDGDQRLGLAVLVGLKEIGADRRLHRIDEVAQDAVLVQALDLLQCLFDARGDVFLLVVARRLSASGARIEARVEQRDDIGGDAGVLDQRRPHVVLRIGHADLAQVARQRADQRHVAPHQAAGERERVVAVVFGGAAHHHQEGGFQLRLDSRRDRSRRRRRAPAACRGTRPRGRRRLWRAM